MSHAAKLLQNATSLHQAGQWDAAEKAYRKLLRVDPANSDGLRLLGGLYLQNRQSEQAILSLEKALRLIPRDVETITNLGVALRSLNRREEAIARFRQALELQPDYLSALNNLGGLYHEAGRWVEALTTYDRVLSLYPALPEAHFNCGNTLFVSGRAKEAIARYEYALKLKPDYMDAMINLGMVLSHTGQRGASRQWLDTAQDWFEKALKIAPDNVVALNNLANILRQQSKPEEALVVYRKALRLRPDYAQAAINLGNSLRDLGRTEEAIEACQNALHMKPDSAEAHINLGIYWQDLRQHEKALTHFDAALQLKPTSIDAQWNKALSLLALGRYREGWALHESGLGVTHMRGDCPSPERRWHGENFLGKRLLLWSEQGFGDSLHFVRYAELCKARGGQVILLCPRVLRGLFSHSPFIDSLPEQVEEKDFDLHAPLMSLPYIFDTQIGTVPSSLPYLHIGEEARARWADKFAAQSGLKVGLVWAGNPRENLPNAHLIDKKRSMSLEALRPLFALPNIHFYSLQMGAGVEQIKACGLQDRLINLMGEVKDFEDTGAIVEHLDLVISVDTSVVHLVGGMGQPVWVLSRFDACWRWLENRPENPWYPTARVFGQPKPGDWESVVEQVAVELRKQAEV